MGLGRPWGRGLGGLRRAGHRAEWAGRLKEVPEAETPLGALQAWPFWVWAFFSTGKTLTCPDLSPWVRSSIWSHSQYGDEKAPSQFQSSTSRDPLSCQISSSGL